MMTPTSVISLTIVFAFILETRGQFPGMINTTCRSNNMCLDKTNHVCDTNYSPALCKIKAGKGCHRQPQMCVQGASCQNQKCVCATEPLDSSLCRKQEEPERTTASTTESTTSDVTEIVTTKAPVRSTTTTKMSGATEQTSISLVGHVIPMMATFLLSLLF